MIFDHERQVAVVASNPFLVDIINKTYSVMKLSDRCANLMQQYTKDIHVVCIKLLKVKHF